MSHIFPDTTVRVERFCADGLVFESSEHDVHLKPLSNGSFAGGSIVVGLDVDGEGFDLVSVDESHDYYGQMVNAIRVLTKAAKRVAQVHGERWTLVDAVSAALEQPKRLSA